ncbi:MAG: LuxR C-terminal-related transcriptional regulator [Croceibacterium sp.]
MPRRTPHLADLDGLVASIELTPIATVVTDPRAADNPIIACNAAFVQLTGYRHDEIVGRNCRFLAGERTTESSRAVLREAVAERRTALCETVNYRKDGSAFRNAVMIAPVLDDNGQVLLFIGSQMEIPDSGAHMRRDHAQTRVTALSRRQREVLGHLVRGFRNKQIAGVLGIDEKTVKMHRAAMLTRLGCATSADAIRIAVEAGVAD